MPRYLVERTFPDGLAVPVNNEGAKAVLDVVANNTLDGVTWMRSFVTLDKKKTFASTTDLLPKRFVVLQIATTCLWTESFKSVF